VWTPHGTITPEEPRVRPVPVSLTVNEEPDTVAVAFCLAVQDVAIPSWIVKIWPPESLMVVPALNCCAEENTSLLELDVVSTVPEPEMRSRRVLAAIGASYRGRPHPEGPGCLESVFCARRGLRRVASVDEVLLRVAHGRDRGRRRSEVTSAVGPGLESVHPHLDRVQAVVLGERA